MEQGRIIRIDALAEETPLYEDAVRWLDGDSGKKIAYLSSFESYASAADEFGQLPSGLQNACLVLSAARACRDKDGQKHFRSSEIEWFWTHCRSLPDEALATIISIGLIHISGKRPVYDAIASCPIAFPRLLDAVEERNNTAAFSPELRLALTNLRDCVIGGKSQREARLTARLERMLDYGSTFASLGVRGEFATRFSAWAASLPETQNSIWTDLIKLTVGFAYRTDRRLWKEIKYDASQTIKRLDAETFKDNVVDILGFANPNSPFYYDFSLFLLVDFLRLFEVEPFAIDWAPFVGQGELLAEPVGRLYALWSDPVVAEQRHSWTSGERNSFARQRDRIKDSLRSALTGMTEGPKAIAQLLRMRSSLETAYEQDQIDEKLGELALQHKKSIKALLDEEPVELPDLGLAADGSLLANIGKAEACLKLTTSGVNVTWVNVSGKAVRSAPAGVKRDHAIQFAAFSQKAKEIKHEYRKQIAALQHGWLDGSSWRLNAWHQHYLNHPLRRPAVEALVWLIQHGDRQASVLPAAGRLLGVDGNDVFFPSEARVRLWHPLDEEPDEVFAWRDRIMALEITQPIKQAHREIYVLTDAERKTEVYSNRFAAHILRKRQLNGLRKACGWNTDSYNHFADPERRLPELGIRVEFQMEWAGNEHVATDQVRFLKPGKKGEPINLAKVPPIVFSEIMRDCDLFVAVASVANDPTWSDGGRDGRHRNYWHDWAFGELGQSAKVRRDLIARFAGSLSIADKLEIGERALIVEGKRQKYAIHFGSTDVQILPENRYLCIVPDRSAPEADRVRLPFTGDSQISTILAKAFLLIDEDRITDATILSQL